MGVQMYVSSLLFIYSDARLLKDDSSIFNYLRNFPAVSYCSCTHFTLLTTVLKGFLFLHILAKLTIFCIFFFLVFCIFDSGHHNGCEMVSWSLDLHFSDDWWCWTSFYMPVRHLYVFFREMSVQVLCPFLNENFHFLFHSFSLFFVLFCFLCYAEVFLGLI